MDLGDLKEIEIGHDGKGLAAGWHLQLVAVTNEATGLYTAFPCDRWLDRGEEDGQTVVRLRPLARGSARTTYRVVVYTSDRRGAATDANVYCVLHGAGTGAGEDGQDGQDGPGGGGEGPVSGAREALDNSENNFQRNMIDTFLLSNYKRLGPLTSITIGHDNR